MAEKKQQEKKKTQKRRHAMSPEQRRLYDLRRNQRQASRRPFNGSVAGHERRSLAREARAASNRLAWARRSTNTASRPDSSAPNAPRFAR